jgi:hypothetical protein
MRAEVALRGSIAAGIDIKGVVRTSLHAAFASDAALIIKIYDSITTAEERVRGADLNAWRIVAMVASHYSEVTPGVREFSCLDVFHPGAKHPNRNLMLFLARHSTCVATDTALLIDDESVPHTRECIVSKAGEGIRILGLCPNLVPA